jgi:hypothetical protein
MADSGRDFEADFSQIAAQFAAEDPELREHLRAKMFDDSPPETSDESMEAMITIQYWLDRPNYKRATGVAVASLTRIYGVRLGSEAFRDRA